MGIWTGLYLKSGVCHLPEIKTESEGSRSSLTSCKGNTKLDDPLFNYGFKN